MNCKITLIFPIIFLSFFQIECVPSEYNAFLQQPVEARHAQFVNLSLSKQVDYLGYCYAGRTCEDYFFNEVAKQGESALPYLIERMKTGDEVDKYLIAHVLGIMNREYYKISDPKDLLALRSIIKEMQEPNLIKGTMRELHEVLDDPENLP